MYRKAIVFSGLTAAGKTTHARLLAESLAVPFYSASEVLRSLARERHGTGDAWGNRWHPGLDDVRRRDDIDRQIDSRMLELISEQQCGVFDANFLPWIYSGNDVVKIWIDSSFESRVRKCYVSHLDNARVEVEQAPEIVRQKDEFSRLMLARSRGQAYRPDSDVFDVIVSNTDLMPSATVASSVRGVALFAPLLAHCVDYLLNSGSAPSSPRIVKLSAGTDHANGIDGKRAYSERG